MKFLIIIFFAFSFILPSTAFAQEDPREFNWELSKIRDTKDGAKMAQILGAVGVASAIVLSVSDLPDNATLEDIEKRQNTIKGLAIGGGSLFVIGISIDLHSDRRLIDLLRGR
jgi:hypothetical protein